MALNPIEWSRQRRRARTLLLVFGFLSLACIALGSFVAARNGVPAALWKRDLVGWCVGGLLAALIMRAPRKSTGAAVLAVTPLGLLAALLSAGQLGVHRWISIGPLHMNVAEVVLPGAIVASVHTNRWRWICVFVIAALLVLQPDASQTTSFAGAIIVVLWCSSVAKTFRFGGSALLFFAVVVAWLRHDPLLPVLETEGIIGLANKITPLVAGLALVLLAFTSLSPLLSRGTRVHAAECASLALACYFLLSSITPFLGVFPVPLLGIGMSPIIGFWMGVGMLAGLADSEGTGK